MLISWYGQSCFKIEVKSQNEDLSIVTDPFDSEKTGLKLPRKLVADIVLQTNGKSAHPVETNEGKRPFVINGPGEYEFKGIFFYAIPSAAETGNPGYIFRIEAEDITLVYTGALNYVPNESELQEIEGLDVLFVPVGGHNVLDAKKAASLVSELQPRIVIPMQYKLPGLKEDYDTLQPFLKTMELKPEQTSKLKLLHKNLPVDEMKIIVLEKT